MRMKLADLKIDPDFRDLLPELDAETYTALEKDISANGMIDPIVIWNGFIADGHNRYSICKAHRVAEVEVKELRKTTKSEVMQWIVDHQFGKRNLKKSEQVRLLLKVEEQIQREAKERQAKAGGDKKSDDYKKSVESNLTQAIGEKKREPQTDEIMAKKMGVSKNTWKDMKAIVTQGTPTQKERLDKGGSGNGASTIAREIKAGAKDDERVCIKCGKVKKIVFFTSKKNPNCCNECEAERKRMSNSAAPRSNYYDVNASVEWKFEDVEGEINYLIEDTLKNLRTTYRVHKSNVFSDKSNVDRFKAKITEFIEKLNDFNKEF